MAKVIAMDNRAVNLNTAPEDILAVVPGIGPQRAHLIVQRRPFSNWTEVRQAVPGIDSKMIDMLMRLGASVA
jgi:DNA uptake protein ComE-like DNA-binding protein